MASLHKTMLALLARETSGQQNTTERARRRSVTMDIQPRSVTVLSLQGDSHAPSNILTGADIGFRIDTRNGDTPIGTIVVRIDGKWIVPQFSMGVKRLTSK